MSEAVDRYIKLADQFGARVEAAADDSWGAAAPCEGWTARDVVLHVTDGQRKVAAAITGSGEPEATPDDADPKQVWRDAFSSVKEALGQEGALQKTVSGPMGEMPVEMMVGRLMSSDILVHTWDLARAVGGDERLDPDAVTQAFKGLQPMDAMIRQPGVFGPKVEPPEGADEQTRFLCFLGRQV
ncbi:MAG TPA: TIGR03086 family metal-binding protein [Acidimicrobiales bacterium]|nr:TIGR03086 family metal-binding protein [Acidimicrobiales bacterium]